ncbi:MAG TPA: rhomboid family intramembrane serine protease [Rhodanobacteraceae bacterium]|jgi:membrane associated rhomboid family serine protease|nr:rhomboid family intramembrane serine protease [Rhodanobacteraceae bacterium]
MLYDLPPVTRALLIANVVIFLLEQIPSLQPLLLAYGALWPIGHAQLVQYPNGEVIASGFQFWQVITYAFLHGGWSHIFFNMFALWMFGGPIEHLLGAKHYTFYYFFCAVTAAIAHMLVAHYYTHGFYPTLGASGAIFGLLVAFGVMYPRLKMFLIFLPIPMPAWVFVIGYILLELFFGVSGYESGVAHFAHLGGAIGGFVLLQYWRGKLPIKPKRILTR